MKKGIVLFSILVLGSCKKDNGKEEDKQLPVITITTPTNNQVFTGGQTVSINATINDNDKLSEVHLEIINTTTGAFITHEHYAPGAASYNLLKSFSVQSSISYKIKIEADDANSNIANAEVLVRAN